MLAIQIPAAMDIMTLLLLVEVRQAFHSAVQSVTFLYFPINSNKKQMTT